MWGSFWLLENSQINWRSEIEKEKGKTNFAQTQGSSLQKNTVLQPTFEDNDKLLKEKSNASKKRDFLCPAYTKKQ